MKEVKEKLENKEKKKDGKKYSPKNKRISRAIVKGLFWLYLKIVYRFKIIGKENIPQDGGIIFCANHRSFLEPPLMAVTCKRDDCRFLAKKELVNNPIFNLLGIIFQVILVNRDAKDVTALKESVKTLKAGNCIALFPEGTRNGMDKGEKVKGGASYFALNTDAKVVPIGIKGGTKLFQKVVISYGKPMDFSEYRATKKEKETIENVTDEIMDKIIELSK